MSTVPIIRDLVKLFIKFSCISGLICMSVNTFAIEPRFDNSGLILRSDGTYQYPEKAQKHHKNMGDRMWRDLAFTGREYIGISDDGYLWGRGDNKYGLLDPAGGLGSYLDFRIVTATDKKFKEIEAGLTYAMALDYDGNLWTWGTNEFGVLGFDDGEVRPIAPRQLPSTAKWKMISAGSYHALAIDENGYLWAWGKGEFGAIGDGDTLQRNAPVRIGNESDWQFIDAGSQRSLAIKNDGTLWVWGKNIGEDGFMTTPHQVGNDRNWSYAEYIKRFSVETLFMHREDQTSWAVTQTSIAPQYIGDWRTIKTSTDFYYGWDNTLWAKQFDTDSPRISEIFPANYPSLPYPVASPQQIGNDVDWQYLVTTKESVLAGKADKSVWRWGYYTVPGLVWSPEFMLTSLPKQSFTGVSAIDVGFEHVVFIDNNHNIRLNGTYRWQDDTTVYYEGLKRNLLISGTSDWKAIYSGDHYFFALRNDNTLWGWGRYGWPDKEGYLGLGEENLDQHFSEMVEISAGTKWRSFAMSKTHILGVKDDGTLWAWGNNQYGQVAAGSNVDFVFSVQQVGQDSNWKTVFAGYNQSAAIKQDGTLWTWGENAHGQLGFESFSMIPEPRQVGTDNDWDGLAFGKKHTLARKSDQTLWAWGDNSVGQLGNGEVDNDITDNHNPVKISNDADWVKIAAGDEFSVAIKSNGSLWSWGNGMHGQLGNGVPAKSPGRLNEAPLWQTKPVFWDTPHPRDIEHISKFSCENTAALVDTPPNQLFSYSFNAEDPDGHLVEYTLGELPVWMHYESQTQTIYGTPGADDFGCSKIVITASDGISSTELVFNVVVNSQPLDINLSNLNLWKGAEVKTWGGEGYSSYIDVGRLTTDDDDNAGAAARTYTYSILEGTDSTQFAIEGDMLRFIGNPNTLDSLSSFTLTIESIDELRKRTNTTFTIKAIESNGPPVDVNLSNNRIPENVVDIEGNNSERLLGKLVGIDSEYGDVPMLALTGGDLGYFKLTSIVDGEYLLWAKADAMFDYETTPILHIEVTATDSHNQSLSKTLEIFVDDVNEAPTGLLLSPNHLPEGFYPRFSVIGHLTAIDQDNADTHQFYIESSTNEDYSGPLFTIEDNTLLLAEDYLLDVETARSHEVSVKIVDRGGITVTKVITLTLDEVVTVEANFEFSSETIFEGYSESEKVLGKFVLIGIKEHDEYLLVVSGSHADLLFLKGNMLYLSSGIELDTETQSHLEFDVKLIVPGQEDVTKHFLIDVLNVNEPPQIASLKLTDFDSASGFAEFDLRLVDLDTNSNDLLVQVNSKEGIATVDGIGSERKVRITGIGGDVRNLRVTVDLSDGEFAISNDFDFSLSATVESPSVEMDEEVTDSEPSGVGDASSSTTKNKKSWFLSFSWNTLVIFILIVFLRRKYLEEGSKGI